MEYRLGKTFTLPPVDLTAPDSPPTPIEKLFVDEVVLGVDGSTLKLNLPPADEATHRKLVELRAYLVPHDQQPPADVNAYTAEDCPFPYAVVDVSELAPVGGPVEIELPEVDRVAPYFGQLVHGYED
jgi:hypothetical protein